MADVKKNALPNVGDYVDTPRFMTVDIAEVFDSYEDMLRAGYTEPTHFRGDFKVNGKSKDEYHMTFACSPNPDYRASTKKSTSKPQSFSDMVKKQRDKNIQKTIYGTASFESLYRGFDELGTAEQWWVITYLKDKLGMNGFEEFIDNVVAYAYDKYEGQ